MQDELEEFDLCPETGPWAPVRFVEAAAPGRLRASTMAVRVFALATAVLVGAALLKLAAAGPWM